MLIQKICLIGFWRATLLGCAGLIVCGAAQADAIYKVVGPDGKVTYTTVAPTETQKATQLRMDVPAPEASKSTARSQATSAQKNDAPAKPPEPEKSLTQSAKELFSKVTSLGASAEKKPPDPHFGKPILFYKVIGCPDCDVARRYFSDKRIQIRGIDVSTEDGRRAFNEIDRNAKLPLLIAKGKRMQGLSVDAYDEIFRDHKP
jgi:glutaredoxin